MLYRIRNCVGLFALACAGGAAGAELYFAEPRPLDTAGFQQIFSQVAPNVFLSGQPSQLGLAKVREMGVTTVVNLRTNLEMNDRAVVPFDEEAHAAQLGLNYVHVPQGGPSTPYSPEAVARFADAVERADGGVLLHCTVAWRATHLWVAYLVEYRKLAIGDALAIGQQLNLGGMPLEGFLGRKLVFVLE